MQQDKHPDYRPVVFRDRGAGYAFLTRSTATSDQTIVWDDGETYPVVEVEISSRATPSTRARRERWTRRGASPASSGVTARARDRTPEKPADPTGGGSLR